MKRSIATVSVSGTLLEKLQAIRQAGFDGFLTKPIELPVPITTLTVPLPFASVHDAVRSAGTNPVAQTESASAGVAVDIAKPSPNAQLPSRRVRIAKRFIDIPL